MLALSLQLLPCICLQMQPLWTPGVLLYLQRGDQCLVAGSVNTNSTVIHTSANASILLIAVRIAVSDGEAVQEAAVDRADLDIARDTLVE
jgi:hypothetical protein